MIDALLAEHRAPQATKPRETAKLLIRHESRHVARVRSETADERVDRAAAVFATFSNVGPHSAFVSG